MTDNHEAMKGATGLRLRRTRYELGVKLGFFGYRIGSPAHALQRIVRPLRHMAPLTKTCGGFLAWAVSYFAASIIGIDDARR